MSQMFCGILDKFGIEQKVVTTVADAVEEIETYQPQMVVLDTSVDRGNGMSFISALTPEEEEKESRKDRRKKIENGPNVMIVRTVYEVVPNDCPFVKSSLVRPFTSEQLTDTIREMIPKENKAEVPRLFEGTKTIVPELEIERRGMTFGESYVFFEKAPVVINQVVQVFANAGYDMLLLTHLRPKVAREKYGLDRGAEVFTLSGYDYPLGTMIEAVGNFIQSRKYPLVALGDLDDIIEHSGLDLAMRAIQQMLSFRKNKNLRFTLLTSVDDSLLTPNVRNLLTEMMTEYKEE